VDDDDTLLKFFKIHLNKFFSRVIVVENAKQALENMRDKEIDLILTDIRMPKVDGLQLMQKIRKAHPDIPVLLISGEPMSETQQKTLDEADGFLSKPFSVDQLNDFIHFGADLRQVFRELTPFVKDVKKLRSVIKASDKEILALVKKEHVEEAKAICAKWKTIVASTAQSAA
jgi:DNA-binding NtrC family response regulator